MVFGSIFAVIFSTLLIVWSWLKLARGKDWPIGLVLFLVSPLIALGISINVAAQNSKLPPSFDWEVFVNLYFEWLGLCAVPFLIGVLGRLYRSHPMLGQLVLTTVVAIVTLSGNGGIMSDMSLLAMLIISLGGLVALWWRRPILTVDAEGAEQ